MPRVSPARFVRQVRQEVGKVTWPTRAATLSASGMVLLIAFVMSLFFLGIDELISYFIGLIIG